MRNLWQWLAQWLLAAIMGAAAAQAQTVKVRVKDAARMDGMEEHSLVGFGLIVGLAGTGDQDPQLTQRTMANLMHNFNIVIDENEVTTPNAAAVIITAVIRGPAHKGDMIPATISTVGDATSLTGGELLLTPLLGTDGEVWGIAQGPLTIGGFRFGSSGAGGNVKAKNHPTTAMLTNGLKLLKNVNLGVDDTDVVGVNLKKPDFSTAVNMAEAINREYVGAALAVDAGTVKVRVPQPFNDSARIVEFIHKLGQVSFSPDRIAKVVFNERTGTIVIGSDVKISSVAISHGSISVSIKETEDVSQPNPLAGGASERTTDQTTDVVEGGTSVQVLPTTTTVGELVNVLNALGVKSRDIMVIFHALRQAGALHAELQAM